MYNMFKTTQHEEVFYMATIADRIKMLRSTSGMTQEEFGKVFGIVKSTVSLYESGKSCPNDQIKLQICEYFNVPLDFLIGISNVSTFNTDEFNKGILSDGCCHSAFVDLIEIRKTSIAELISITGLERAVLENWFIKEVPSLQQLVLVADALQTSVDYLLGRTDDFNQLSEEVSELISYYEQLPRMDKRWIIGQMIGLIKKYEDDIDPTQPPVAAEGLRKASGK